MCWTVVEMVAQAYVDLLRSSHRSYKTQRRSDQFDEPLLGRRRIVPGLAGRGERLGSRALDYSRVRGESCDMDKLRRTLRHQEKVFRNN